MRGLGEPTVVIGVDVAESMPLLETRWRDIIRSGLALECPPAKAEFTVTVTPERIPRWEASYSRLSSIPESFECETWIPVQSIDSSMVMPEFKLPFAIQATDFDFVPKRINVPYDCSFLHHRLDFLSDLECTTFNPTLFNSREFPYHKLPFEFREPLLEHFDMPKVIPRTSTGHEQQQMTTQVVSCHEEGKRALDCTVSHSPRSKLFPRILMVVPGDPVTDPSHPPQEQITPAVICDPALLNNPDFTKAFSDCRIISRKLKYVTLELDEKTGVIIGQFKLDTLISAMCCFETVYLINISEKISADFSSQSVLRVRNFQTLHTAFKFLRGLVSPSASHFVREKESLHEHLLWLFPMISRSLALHMLAEGNPISDRSCLLDVYPTMNACLFKSLIDMPTMSFSSRQVSKRKSSAAKTRQKHQPEILAFVPGVTKVSAPWPNHT